MGKMSSNTICVSQEGPANALALNRDCTQVVIAGRNVFKVFSIDNDEFSEICNLRVGKNLNLNFSSIDVAWNTIEENTLATAATNGAVVVWNLGRSGRSKQEHVFSDHKRTVNKVSFHLTDPALLISGSQDGMMKCFDLRMKEVVRTFLSNTESVRDVQFSPHSAHTFAAVSENGNVQLWDARRAERCFHQFTAHSGPVFACDWHPEVPWLATASRDKTIKVWDIHGKPSLEHTIYTIASVGHVKWRPQKKYHIASCALVLDSSVNIWDVRRPHVPFATFAEHRDVTTAIAWKADPDVFLSTSRDCTLYRHTFRDALHPVMSANPHGVSISPRGELALASSKHRNPAVGAPSLADRIQGFIGRKQHNWSVGWQQQLEAAFPGAGVSALTRWPGDSGAALAGCARRYRLRGAPLHELCAHNASVARDYGRDMVSHVWLVVGVLYQFRAPSARPDWGQAANAVPPEEGGTGGVGGELAAPDASGVGGEHGRAVRGEVYNYGVDDEPETEEWSENQFHNSGVLGMPTQSIYIPPLYNRHDSSSRDEDKFWLTAASAHYVDLEAADWALPEEAFPLRSAAPDAQSNNGSGLAEDGGSEGASGDVHGSSTTNPAPASQPTNACQPGAAAAPHSPGSSGSNQSQGPPPPFPAQTGGKVVRTNSVVSQHSAASALTTVEDQPIGELRVWEQPSTPAWDGTHLLADALKLHAELGDVQTSVTVMLVLGENRNDLFPYIDEATQEHWLLGYLELLARHKLWNVSTEIIQCAWVASVWQLSQQSTTVHLACGPCGRHLARPGHAPCERCTSSPSVCAVCHEVVRGLYAWCQGCAHGGHVQHMQKWFSKYKQCPTGCGHHCEYS